MNKGTIEVGKEVIFQARDSEGNEESSSLNGQRAKVLELYASQEGGVNRHKIRFLGDIQPTMLASVTELMLPSA